jgi:hypothetical protein
MHKAKMKILRNITTFIFGDFQVLEKDLEKRVRQGAKTMKHVETWNNCSSS